MPALNLVFFIRLGDCLKLYPLDPTTDGAQIDLAVTYTKYR